jgi:U3 small nucleolar RNA-associated protein 23
MNFPTLAVQILNFRLLATPNFARMRQQRAKRYRKAMALYQTTFKFREPYQVLLSSDFLLDAYRFKLNLASLLERTIQGQLKLSNLFLCLRRG